MMSIIKRIKKFAVYLIKDKGFFTCKKNTDLIHLQKVDNSRLASQSIKNWEHHLIYSELTQFHSDYLKNKNAFSKYIAGKWKQNNITEIL